MDIMNILGVAFVVLVLGGILGYVIDILSRIE